jgi:hypothetical protein
MPGHCELPSPGARGDADDGGVDGEDRTNTREQCLLVFRAEPLDREFLDRVRHSVDHAVTHVEYRRLERVREDRHHFGCGKAGHRGGETECHATHHTTDHTTDSSRDTG